jgi:membrane-associated protein
MSQLLDIFLHIDKHLALLIGEYGVLIYGILFAVIFIETGFVVMPFLPGDSLLFATGAFVALDALDLAHVLVLLSLAAILGDTLNYWIGRRLGHRAHAVPWINQAHLDSAQAFFERYGGKTIVLARFVPIIRTFAPFVAGMGRMSYVRFILFNIVGGVAWVMICCLAGYFFGNIPVVKQNFELVILGIVLISFIPVIIEFIKHKNRRVA